MTDWLTTLQAGELLGLNHRPTTISMLSRHHIEGYKEDGGHARWFWNRQGVEHLFAQREVLRQRQALGLKYCPRCKLWKDRKAEFHKRHHLCKVCRPIREAELKQRKHRKTFANMNPVQSDGGEDWHAGEPPKPGDSDKYACMFGWFQHKPIPPGTTKRKLYCKVCVAPRCVHHPEMMPKEVMRYCRVPSRYPAHQVADYADA